MAVPTVNSVAIEAALTFLLMLVIIAVATDRRADGAVPGLAIGLTVVFDVQIGGAATGGSMNPALFGGPSAIHQYWIYVVGPLADAGNCVACLRVYTWPSRTRQMRTERSM